MRQNKLKMYVEAYFAERSGIPLNDLVEARAATLNRTAPAGEPPFYFSIQPDGKAVTVEPVRQEQEVKDELALRHSKGDIYSNLLKQRAAHAAEESARYRFESGNIEESLKVHENLYHDIWARTPNHHFLKNSLIMNRIIFMMIALGEVGAMFFLFADFLGLDPMRLGSEVVKHPLIVISTAALAAGFFLSSLVAADKALHSGKRLIWLTALAVVAILIGNMRAIQSAAMHDAGQGVWFLTLLYAVISFMFPLAGAFYAKRASEASQITGPTESAIKRLGEQEGRYTAQLNATVRNKQVADRKLDMITSEYVKHYQNEQETRSRSRRDWELHFRNVEAHLAELRLAYQFWQGWHKRSLSIPKPLRVLAKLTAMAIIALITMSVGVLVAHAGENDYNMQVLCDRSSSMAEYYCTPEQIAEAGDYWAHKADEAGGGEFTVFLIGSGFDDTPVLLSVTYPSRFPGPVMAHKKEWRIAFLQRLKALRLPTNRGSAIAEAIYRVSLRIPRNGETEIYVLSDMREVDDTFNSEVQPPSEQEFLKWLDRKAIRPRFTSTTKVVVSGVHPYSPDNTSRMTTENYDRLVRLWRAVFRKWGVNATISESHNFGE